MKSRSPGADSQQDALKFLNKLPLFAGLEQPALADISGRMQYRTFGQGVTLFHQDMPGMMLYMLAEGHVRLYSIGHTAQEFTYHICGPLEIFGELSILDDGYHSTTCIVMTPIKTWLLSRDHLLDILQKYPLVNPRLLRILVNRIRTATSKVEAMAFLDVQGRLAYELLALAGKFGRSSAKGIVIAVPLHQNDLASMVGATRESVNKALSFMRSQKLISVSGSSLVLTNQAGLERLLQERGR